ncbi:hypothetical protein C8J57DRAFT_1530116 [Mycena rebaudengoi]|nr:hypothetical protein C8J57DRAFT_1530116 [Mycena rebaudengoi]
MSSVEKAEALAHLKYTSHLQGFLRGASRAHLQHNEALPMSRAIKAPTVLSKIPYNYLYTLILTLDGTFRLRLRDHDAGNEADELPPLVDDHNDLSGC